MTRTLIAVFLIIVAVALVALAVLPTFRNTSQLRLEEAELREALENAEMLSVAWDQLLDTYNVISPTDVERLNVFLPDNIDNVKMIIEVDTLAQQHGLRIGGVSVTEPELDEIALENNESQSISLEFNLSGDYNGFLEFLGKIENSLRLIDVQDVGVEVARAEGVTYDYTLSLVTHWLPNQSPDVENDVIIPAN